MKLIYICLLPFFCFCFNQINAQNTVTQLDFSVVDSFAATVKYNNSLIQLSKDLTSGQQEEVYKVRSIFKWITENIAYDYKFYNKGAEQKGPNCENAVNCEQNIAKWEDDFLNKVIRKKKAVCAGYALLFKKLCNLSGITCEVIDGYARTKPYQIGNNMSVNHAWNAVQINGDWYYLDVTWAAGYCIENEDKGILTSFVKKYQNYYWCTDYKLLRRNHYPKNGRWAAQDNFTKEHFFYQPHYYNQDILENILLFTPDSGFLNVKKGDTIHFKFRYYKNISKLQINSNIFSNPSFWYKEEISRRKSRMVRDTSADRKQVYIPFTKKEDIYEFTYVVQNTALYYLDIIFDYQKALRYRIKVIGQ